MSMKGFFIVVAALVIGGPCVGAAFAAEPAYCALYAREYAVDTVQPTAAIGMLQSVQDQAYYRCLNQDEEPQLPRPPSSSSYFSTDLAPPSSTVAAVASGDQVEAPTAPASVSPAPVALAPVAPAVQPKTVAAGTLQSPAVYHGSGLTAGTPEWQAWCAKSFPNSWDPKTGTVIHQSSPTHERVLCK